MKHQVHLIEKSESTSMQLQPNERKSIKLFLSYTAINIKNYFYKRLSLFKGHVSFEPETSNNIFLSEAILAIMDIPAEKHQTGSENAAIQLSSFFELVLFHGLGKILLEIGKYEFLKQKELKRPELEKHEKSKQLVSNSIIQPKSQRLSRTYVLESPQIIETVIPPIPLNKVPKADFATRSTRFSGPIIKSESTPESFYFANSQDKPKPAPASLSDGSGIDFGVRYETARFFFRPPRVSPIIALRPAERIISR